MIKIAFTGDILSYPDQNRRIKKQFGSYDYSTVYENASGLFCGVDYVVGSLETVISEKHGLSDSPVSFNTPKAILHALKKAGFDLVTLANNHCLDRGLLGVEETIKHVSECGLEYTGTRRYIDESPYLIKEIGDCKIAFLSYTYDTNPDANGCILDDDNLFHVNLTKRQEIIRTNSPSVLRRFIKLGKRVVKFIIGRKEQLYPSGPVLDCVSSEEISNIHNQPYLKQLQETIKNARKQSDFIIFCLHAGGQFNDSVGEYTQYVIEEILSYGADAVICNHTHCILPIKNKSKVVAYSLGNFSFTPSDGYYIDGVYADYSVVLYLQIDKPKHTISPSVAFVKNVIDADKIARVYPVFDLIKSERCIEKKEKLEKDLMSVMHRVGMKVPVKQFLQSIYILD